MRSIVLPLAALALFAVAAVLGLWGWTTSAVVAFVMGALIVFAAGVMRRRRRAPIGDVEEPVRAAVRARRDADGEIAAVRELRRHRPRADLSEAQDWVRSL